MTTTGQPPPPGRFNLAKAATILAVVFILAFGLCTASVMSSGNSGADRYGFLIPLSLGTEALCLLGLVTVAILAIVRSVRGH